MAALRSPLDTGTASGEYFTPRPAGEMAQDQRADDAGSLVVQTAPLEAGLDLLVRAALDVAATSDAPAANLCARLVDVQPDGTATRIAVGVLNLTHRDGDAAPEPMPLDTPVPIRLTPDACVYRLRPGHRQRLSLSTAYWPLILPPPTDATLGIDLASLALGLPLLGDYAETRVPEPADPDPLPRDVEHVPGSKRRQVVRDLDGLATQYRIHDDTGLTEHPAAGLATRQIREETWRIEPGDPLSSEGWTVWTREMSRGAWSVRTVSTLDLRCSAEGWILSGGVRAETDGEASFETSFERKIPRDDPAA